MSTPSDRAAIEAAKAEPVGLADSEAPTVRTGSGELKAYREPAIVAHRLTYGEWVPAEFPQDRVITPELIVIHYTVTQTKPGVVATFRQKDFLSCHLTIGRDGSITQMVPFNRKAYHAGESSWKGRPSVNAFSIGIELVNPGPGIPVGNGRFNDVYGRPWYGKAVQRKHKHPGCKYDWWAEFDDEQVDATIRVCAELVSHYSILHVVGHEDVSPGRKIDPGPAFPWEALLQAVYPKEHQRP